MTLNMTLLANKIEIQDYTSDQTESLRKLIIVSLKYGSLIRKEHNLHSAKLSL